MSTRYGNRHQIRLLPPSIEEYVGEDDPVRFYDVFVDSLDIESLGLKVDKDKLGCPSFDKITMLKIIIYSYSYGWRSSRKIERALHHNLSFIWLSGGLKPNFRTINKFRKDNIEAIKSVLKQSIRICYKLGLIDGNILFEDGSKLRGNAGMDNSYDKKRLEDKLKAIDEKIEKLIGEIEQEEKREKDKEGLIRMSEKLSDKEKLRSKIKEALEDINVSKKNRINLTDKDCIGFKSRQGNHTGYNVQIVADNKHGLIVQTEALSQSNDLGSMSEQIEKANENIGKEEGCKTVCADAGYYSVDDLAKLDKKSIEVIVPSPKQINNERKKAEGDSEENKFGLDKFKFDEELNCFICPEGEIIPYSYYQKSKNCDVYRLRRKNICNKCKHFGVCTKYDFKTIYIKRNHKAMEKWRNLYNSEEGQEIYRKRKQLVELPFGHIKRNLDYGYFLLRGREAVNAELSLIFNSFNLTRLINILGGATNAMNALKSLRS